MKKMFLSLMVALMAVTNVFAQSSMLATLSHEGQISTFYGTTALRDAYNAAVQSDTNAREVLMTENDEESVEEIHEPQ